MRGRRGHGGGCRMAAIRGPEELDQDLEGVGAVAPAADLPAGRAELRVCRWVERDTIAECLLSVHDAA